MINKNKIKNARLAFYSLLAFFCFNLNAQQNLVPNWSFEDTLQCPFSGGQISFTKYWTSPTIGTPDYANSCSQWVYPSQTPRTGVAYVGMFIFQVNPPSNVISCESIQVPLADSLTQNKVYCGTFYVKSAKMSLLACSDIGAFVSANAINRSDSTVFHYTPQIENPYSNFITDTMNWTKVSGTFTANGGEKYFTISNFDLRSDTIRVNYGNQWAAYIFVDDVSLVEVSPAFAGNDTSYCTLDTAKIGGTSTFEANYIWTKESGNAFMDSNTIAQPKVWANSSGTTTFIVQKTQCSVITYDTVNITFACVDIKENNFDNLFSVYPNPANDEIIILSKQNEKFSVSLKDISGREVKNISILSEEKNFIRTNELESGIYFLNFQLSSSKNSFAKKIVISH